MKTSRMRGRARTRAAWVVPLLVASLFPVLRSQPAFAWDACAAGHDCVTVDATTALGPVTLREQGFLHGPAGGLNASRVNALNPKNWRIACWPCQFSPTYGSYGDYNAATSYSGTPSITHVLSDDWDAYSTSTYGGLEPPWAHWTDYENMVTQVVQSSITNNKPVAYWGVFNEPNQAFASCSNACPGTQSQRLEVFKRANDRIRALLPSAKLMGPDLASWSEAPGGSNPAWFLSLQSLLDYLDANPTVKYDAISWHELGGSPPNDVVTHVSSIRTAIAAKTNLGVPSPEIYISEYSGYTSTGEEVYKNPGWEAGYLSAMEVANVDRANKACWNDQDSIWHTYSNCLQGLDGLLASDGNTTRAAYWVHQVYASAPGTRVAWGCSDPSLGCAAYATTYTSGSYKDVRVLMGRYAGASSVTVDYQVKVGFSPQPANVHIQYFKIPKVATGFPSFGALSQPTASTDAVVPLPADGILPFTQTGVKNGDAGLLYVTAA